LIFVPKLIQEKKFSKVSKNLNIFVEKYKENGVLEGIYIKEKLNNDENKIIISSKGKLIQSNDGYKFKLYKGKIINIDKKGNFNLGFKETIYELDEINFKTRKEIKLGETKTSFLIYCLNKFINSRKDDDKRCGQKDNFLIKDIYEETFKRIVNPSYIIILSLISSLLILKLKVPKFQNYFKFFLFLLGFFIIIFSEFSYKFVSMSLNIEILFISMPILFIILFYLIILLKTNFKPKYL